MVEFAICCLLVYHACPSARLSAEGTPVASITAGELRSHVYILADDTFEGRAAGSRGAHAAAHYISSQLRSTGLKPLGIKGSYYQPFGANFRNVLACLEGRDSTDREECIIIGAHYDHVGFGKSGYSHGPRGKIHNGADDNASGVSAVLEIAQAFTHLERRLRRTIAFALWDAEEQGLLGSQHWLEHPTLPLGSIICVINLDMVGRLQGDRMYVFGSRSCAGFRELVSRHNGVSRLRVHFPRETERISDHYPFFANEIPYLAFHTGLHKDYHRPSDDAHRINFDGMQRIARVVFEILLRLADGPPLEGFRDAELRDGVITHRQHAERSRPPRTRLGVRWRDVEFDSQGVVLTSVLPGSPAERAGLRQGDRIIRFAGARVFTSTFRYQVARAENPVALTLERPPKTDANHLSLYLNHSSLPLGMSIYENDAEPRVAIVAHVMSNSPAHRAGIRSGDRIYSVNHRRFRNVTAFRKLIDRRTAYFNFLVERNGRLDEVAIQESLSGHQGLRQ